MKTLLLSLIFLFCFIQLGFAQEDDGVVSFDLPIRNSLVFNRFAINPTFSFVREQNKYFSISNKREWVQFDNAPETYLANYSGRFSENIGAGLAVFQQNYGVLTTFGGLLNFAYNAKLNTNSNLTFGLNIGAYKSGVNTANVVTNFDDPSLQNVPSNFLLTVNPGINYGTEFLDFGISVKNLVLYNFETSALIEDDAKQGIQAHIMHTGYFEGRGFFTGTKISALLKSEFRKDETIISGLAMINVPKGLWLQLGYNNVYGVSGGLGINISSQIALEYNIEKAIGDMVDFGPSHDITLAYRFKPRKDYKYSGDDEVSGLFSRSSNKKPVVKLSEAERESIRTRAAERKVQAELDLEAKKKAVVVAEAKAKLDAEEKVKKDAITQAKFLEEQKVKEEADKIAKEEADQLAKARAATRAKIAANQKDKLEAETKAKLLANQKAKAEADAQAKLLAEQKAQEDAKLIAEQEVKEAAETQAKLVAEQKAKEDADAQAKLVAEQKAKEVADAQAKLVAEQKAKENADAQAKLVAEQKAKEVADAQAKLVAEQKAKEVADAQAKLVAEQKAKEVADAQAKLVAEQKAKEVADVQAKLVAEQKAKEVADAQAKLVAEQKAKESVKTPVKLTEEQKIKAEADAVAKLLAEKEARDRANPQDKIKEDRYAPKDKLINPQDEIGKSMQAYIKQAEIYNVTQIELLKEFDNLITIKNQDLKDLKKENDLSDQGITVQPKPFKSVTSENNKLNALKSNIDNLIKTRGEEIDELKTLYEKRTRIKNTELDEVNLYYKTKIKRLEEEQLIALQIRTQLETRLETIRIATEFEKRRRIKRAAFDSEEDRYSQDRAALQNIKATTTLSNVPLKIEDFDFGEEQGSSINILKNIKNVENGYYNVIAVHSNIEKRNDFITKVVASGRTDVNFFYDVNTSKYYIYYNKFDNIQNANEALDSKGNRPYNQKMSIVKIEN